MCVNLFVLNLLWDNVIIRIEKAIIILVSVIIMIVSDI